MKSHTGKIKLFYHSKTHNKAQILTSLCYLIDQQAKDLSHARYAQKRSPKKKD